MEKGNRQRGDAHENARKQLKHAQMEMIQQSAPVRNFH
jgi:hypothetical protein